MLDTDQPYSYTNPYNPIKYHSVGYRCPLDWLVLIPNFLTPLKCQDPPQDVPTLYMTCQDPPQDVPTPYMTCQDPPQDVPTPYMTCQDPPQDIPTP